MLKNRISKALFLIVMLVAICGQVLTSGVVNAAANTNAVAASSISQSSSNNEGSAANSRSSTLSQSSSGSQSGSSATSASTTQSSRAITASQDIAISGIGADDALTDDNQPVDATDWKEGSQNSIHYNFAISDDTDIQAGDTSTLTLPNGAVFKADESFDIKSDSGQVIGHFDAKFKENTGTITWSNYYATNTNNRRGTLKLTVTGKVSLPANVVYLNKNGWETGPITNGVYTQIAWELRINPKANNIENAKVVDTVANTDTQTLDKNSIIVRYNDTQVAVSPDDYTLSVADNTFTLSFNKTLTKDVQVVYTTTLTKGIPYLIDGTRMVFANKAVMTGHDVTNNYTLNESASKDVMLGSNGSGSGAARDAILTKKDAFSGQAIEGTHFKLVDAAGNTVLGYNDLITDANGQIRLTSLPSGNYALIETKAQSGYILDETPQKFTITDDQQSPTIIMFNNNQGTSISGTKTWKDNDNQDGKRPTTITVELLADGKQVASQKVTANDNWQYSFKNLQKYENGKEVNYTVDEVPVAGYTKHVDGTNITNSHDPEKTNVTITKAWDDKNNQDGLRPSDIKVQLQANGIDIGDTVNLTSAENWQHSWQDLPKYANGKLITYSAKEVDVPDGYTETSRISESDPNDITVTNTHTPSTTTVSGTKTWRDNDNQDGERPTAITVNLLADGKQVSSQQVTASNDWKYSFTNLPKYAGGKKIVYTVTENQVKGYTTTIDNTNIINSRTSQQTSVTVTKAWNDGNDQDKLRPNSVKVQLYGNGEKVGNEVTLTSENKWTYSWQQVPRNAAGSTVKYTVKEIDIPSGYSSTVTDSNIGNIIITNSHTPDNKPSEPTVPIVPTNPVEPTKPVTPTKPIEPTSPVKPTTPAKPEAPSHSNEPTVPSQKKAKTNTTPVKKVTHWLAKHHLLPQTNDRYSVGLTLLGIIVLFFVIVMMSRKRRKN